MFQENARRAAEVLGTLIRVGWLAVEGARERVFCVPGALEVQVVGSELPASTAQR